MAIAFRQNIVKISLISVLCKKCVYGKVFGVGEFKYAIKICSGSKGRCHGNHIYAK